VEKSNDILMKGLRDFAYKNPHTATRLLLAKWRNDSAKSEKLIEDLEGFGGTGYDLLETQVQISL